jgi:DNA-3-methyladenine glycosylase
MKQELPQSFFNRPVQKVARELLGSYLVRRRGRSIERYQITETEAYDGSLDLACHAAKGRTKRTEVMFGEAGRMYVYLIYGMYWMLNIVTGEKDYPAAVLIRGIVGAQGPGKLTKRLKITGVLNGKKLGKKSGVWIEKGQQIPNSKVEKTARIGVDYAGPIWSKKEWRFVVKK